MRRVRHISLRTQSEVIRVTLEVISRNPDWKRPAFIDHTNDVAEDIVLSITKLAGAPVFAAKVK